MRWPHTGPDRLGKKIHVVVNFARHLFADGVEHFEKTGSAIHKMISNLR
jgi:hypothetical protein